MQSCSSRLLFVAMSLSLSLVFVSPRAYGYSIHSDTTAVRRPHWYALQLADVVVQGTSPASPAAPVTQAAPVAEPSRREIVHTEVVSNHNYMGTVAMSAISGGVLGVLVGGAIYYLASGQRARNIIYWGAGGVLVGAAVGVTQVMIQESRASAALSTNLPTDPAPTLRVALYQTRF